MSDDDVVIVCSLRTPLTKVNIQSYSRQLFTCLGTSVWTVSGISFKPVTLAAG